MKYLFIGAHVDDIALSCGGFITKLKESDNFVHCMTLSHIYNGVDLFNEYGKSSKVIKSDFTTASNMKVREFNRQEVLDVLIRQEHYDYIITHSSKDFHQDHKLVGEESIRAFKTKNLITYTGDWNRRTVTHNYFVKLKKGHIEKKIKALACYESQKHRPYMSPDYIWANARNMGVMAGCEFAEGFEVINLYDS